LEEKNVVQCIQDRDTVGIGRIIAQSDPKPELMGMMQNVIDLVIVD
jgi:ubiquitin